MKIRVLYPPAFAELKKPPKAGDVIDLDNGAAYVEIGYAEKSDAKAPPVERATAAPGEKRKTTRKK